MSDVPQAAVPCGLAARAWLSASAEDVAALRKCPGPPAGEALPATFLRHADEQTVVGLAAVLRAIADHELTGPFDAWAVIAAPRFVGRSMLAQALPRFVDEGAWGVSPHLIPHRSLHSISGAVSVALKARGPNFGVGGGPAAEAEALLAAAALLHATRPPGVWVVFTRVEPEPDAARPDVESHCQALALALVAADAPAARARLALGATPPGTDPWALHRHAALPGPHFPRLRAPLIDRRAAS